MKNTSPVYARIDKDLKDSAEEVLDQLGLTPSALIQMLYRQVVIKKSVPFDISLPNAQGHNAEERLHNNTLLRTGIGQDPFSALINDILNNAMTDRQDVLSRQAAVPKQKYGKIFTLIVITPSLNAYDINGNPSEFQNKDLQDLSAIFPLASIVKYKENILVFAAMKGSAVQYSRPKLEDFLDKKNARAGVGVHTWFLSALPAAYQQCLAAIRLGVFLSEDPDQRIFEYRDFSMYFFIDMCTSDAFKDFHHGKYHFYCCQEYLDIVRYDRNNGTDMRGILYVYLSNNCRVGETARILFLHRNTLVGKIKKIEELMGHSLDDSMLREQLMFSFHVDKYIEKYRKIKLSLSEKQPF